MATSIASMLPEDLIIEILSRFPVKTLLRFKAVSRTWKNIITSSYFQHQHFRQEDNSTDLLVISSYFAHQYSRLEDSKTGFLDFAYSSGYVVIPRGQNEHYSSRYKPKPLFPNGTLESPQGKGLFTWEITKVCGPCNGIICMKVSAINFSFVLWNPATREFWPIPETEFEERMFNNPFSFWIDPLTNEFKIFYIVRDELDLEGEPRFVTYTSYTDSWTESQAPFYPGDHILVRHCYSVLNGFYYFLKFNMCESYLNIIAYDIREDLFQEIEMPNIEIHSGPSLINLDLFGDSLALFALEDSHYSAEIWLMKEKGCWTKLFNVDRPYPFKQLGFWKGSVIFTECDGHELTSAKLIIYDPVSRNERRIEVETTEGVRLTRFFALCYKQSLISFKTYERKKMMTDLAFVNKLATAVFHKFIVILAI